MSWEEIACRARKLLWQVTAKIFCKRWEARYRSSSANFQVIPETLDTVKFYGLSDIRPQNVPDEWVNSTIEAAEKLLKHRYNYLALGQICLGEKIKWNHEYKRNIDLSLEFGPWMDYHNTDKYGDFRYSWELPRLQHLITLSKAYYLTGNEKYAREVVGQLNDFDNQSPYLMGVNWIMPMEAGIRLISLCWVIGFLKNFLKKDICACRTMEFLIVSHTDYIVSNYAAYSSANNHLIGEAAGVFVAAICFGNLKGMHNHQSRAYQILCEEIIRQNYEDGVNKEQAVHYQVFTFNFLLLAGLLGRANGIEFPGQYWKMLEKSAAFIAAIADDNCLLPKIGDSDDGRAVVLSETDCNPVRSILATSAILFKRNDYKSKAGAFDETSFWMLGHKGKAEFDSLKGKTETLSTVNKFEEGGYYILNGNGKTKARIIFDCGPLGFGTIAAHGHADCLSFILNCYDRPYFIDPGAYTYVPDNPYRNYFRSTAAHNTIVIDGCDQSQIAGAFMWTHKAKSFTDEWVSNEHFDMVSGWHNGYRRFPDAVTHRRIIKLDKKDDVVIITDYLEMESCHKVEQYFHLAPQCLVAKVNSMAWQIANAGKKIEIIADEKLRCEVYYGSENLICGWFSNSYDQKVPTNTFVCHGVFRGNQCFTTKIRLAL
jgi:hypothetical protein